MNQWILSGIATAVFLASPVAAQSGGGQFAVEGAGRLNCAAFTLASKDKSSAEYQRMIGFVEGYLSAGNRYEADTFDLTPWHNAAALDIILRSHCDENAEDTLVSVVQQMVTGFRPIRVAKFSPLVEVGDDTRRTFIYETILRRTQAALKAHGLYKGEEDGRYSVALRDAVKSFQQQKSLEATGVPDPATLWTLLNP